MGDSAQFESPVLSIEQDEYVATVWLDRPEARNAMGMALWRDLPRAMEAVSRDQSVRVVVIAAKGSHFSVGLDLRAMESLLTGADPGESAAGAPAAEDDTDPVVMSSPPSMASRARGARAEVLRLQDSITAVARCPKPVVAAVHGYCIGGGVDLIAACDIRLASADAIFSVREAKMAIVADLGSLQRLPAIISAGHLAELAYTGKDIGADRAKEIGLVNEVSADAESVLKAARALAAEIAANSPVAVQGTKAVLAANEGRTVAEGLDYVATWNAGMLASDDLVEAVTAFMQKRKPKFTGR
ncbi:MAG TPA: crotonase/enoyl-CoA hydratase family protein [Acidimicrobiales bacterium]|nr:crotonase/enoyl-CoA hydratase family protein [Acidimicrobiales bacterium]